jgi:hypothetical protein
LGKSDLSVECAEGKRIGEFSALAKIPLFPPVYPLIATLRVKIE